MIIGIGVDLAEVRRIRDQVARHGEEFLEEFLNPDEIAFCRTRRDPFPSYAARFAAKEAFSKALGTGVGSAFGWRDLRVETDEQGRPSLVLRGRARSAVETRGVRRVHVSLTHESDYAAAVVILES